MGVHSGWLEWEWLSASLPGSGRMVSDCLSDAGVGNEMLTSSLKSKLIALFPETERHVKELCREEAPRDPLAEGMVAFETGNYDAALPLLTEVLEAEPFRVQVWVTVG